MSIFDYSRTPLNREAASVTSQSGCASDDTLTDEQMRENLVEKWKALHDKIIVLPKKSKERKALGKELMDLQNQISAIRPKRKCPEFRGHVMDVIREELSAYQFRRIIDIATKRADAAKANNNKVEIKS